MLYYNNMSGRCCSICNHQSRREIEDALTAGHTVRAVASQFSLNKSSIDRHRRQCLAPKLAAASRMMSRAPQQEVERARAIARGDVEPNIDDVLSLTALLNLAARSLNRLETAADDAAVDGMHMALAALSGQLHRGVETVAKLTGVTKEPEQRANQFAVQFVLGGDVVAQAGQSRRADGASSIGADRQPRSRQRRGVEVSGTGESGKFVMTLPFSDKGS
jgi:transposase-like protein